MNAVATLAVALAALTCNDRSFHLGTEARARTEKSMDRGIDWLLTLQQADGSFRSPTKRGVPVIPLTAMALWAVSESDHRLSRGPACQSAAAFLRAHLQPDGGIYEPEAGLARYTSVISRRALLAWIARYGRSDADAKDTTTEIVRRIDRFLAVDSPLESVGESGLPSSTEVAANAIKLLRDQNPGNDDVKRALRFLERLGASDTVSTPDPTAATPIRLTYNELLRYIGEVADKDSESVRRTHAALRSHYTLEENPDLTQRFEPGTTQRRDAGLFYYYLTIARTMGALESTILETVDGVRHDWARELSERLVSLQNRDGSWLNGNGRWWEYDPALTTCYCLISLSICQNLKEEIE